MAGAGRERDPQPLNRQAEVAFVALAGVVLLLTWAAVAGQGVSAAIFGDGWVWPGGTGKVVPAVGELLSGHPGRGMTPALARQLPGQAAVYGCVGACEVLLIGALVWVGVLVARYRRPGDSRRGMATRYEAAQVLGLRRLRSARAVIRPDLGRLSGWWPRAADGSRVGGLGSELAADSMRAARGLDPAQVGWRLGRSATPRGVDLWVRFDRTAGVFGAQGSGKTLDLLAPALLRIPGRRWRP